MYIAALRIADDFGLDAVGIQYQQGLKDLVPASDLAEGLLNNVRAPAGAGPATASRVLWDGPAFPHFNEADEGVAVDALVTNRVWTAMGLDPATTPCTTCAGARTSTGEFVWVFEISGSVPASHLEGGYAGAEGWRQDPVFFPAGGSTINGVSQARRDRVVAACTSPTAAAGRHRPRVGRRAPAPRRRSGARTPPTPSGRSCTSCCTA